MNVSPPHVKITRAKYSTYQFESFHQCVQVIATGSSLEFPTLLISRARVIYDH